MSATPLFDKSLAVVVGINAYQHGITPLSTATNDATRLAQLLSELHGYDVRLLVDEAASLAALTDLFTKQLPAEVGADDRVLFYYAGHGVALDGDEGPNGYLLPQDARRGEESSFLNMPLLHDALTSLPCRHMMVILDSCFSGAFRWSSTRDMQWLPDVIHQERFDRFVSDPAWQVITSASHDQKALDQLTSGSLGSRPDADGHSPFALALFEGLQGKGDLVPADNGDGVITATELYLYLEERLQTATIEAQQRQTPRLWPLKKHDKGEFIFLAPGYEELNLPPAPALTFENNPYRGLKSYDKADAPVFFGRDDVIEALSARVRDQPLMVVLGASGTGKSSVVKAGLLPKLEADGAFSYHLLPVVRPSQNPAAELLGAVATLDPDRGIDARSSNDNADAEALERAHAIVTTWCDAHPEARLVLVVDQLEELVTMTRSSGERQAFLLLLNRLLEERPGQVRFILTMRTDFEPQFADSPLQSRWGPSRYVVPAMTIEEFREVVEGPAGVRVLYFKPSDLVDRLVNEVIQTPGALPLLSFALSEMYINFVKRRSDDRALTEVDYDSVGGVVGSLRTRANEEYDALDEAHRDTMRRVMLRMVTAEGGKLARRRVEKSELQYADPEEDARVQAVVEKLSVARLVVEGRDEGGEPYVEPAHDALVNAWGRLSEWIHDLRDDLADLRFQHSMARAAREWRELADAKASRGVLWKDPARSAVLSQLLREKDSWMNGREVAFAKRSVRSRRRTRVALVATAVVIAGIAAVAVVQRNAAVEQQNIAREQTKDATLRLLSLQADAEWQNTKDGREGPATAKYLYQNLREEPLARGVILKVLGSSYAPQGMLRRLYEGTRVTASSLSADSERVLLGLETGDLYLFDFDGSELAHYVASDTAVTSAAFTDGGNALAAYSDGRVTLWNSGAAVRISAPGPVAAKAVVSRDVSRMVTYNDSSAVLRDAGGGHIANIRVVDGDTLRGAALAADGGLFVLLFDRAGAGCRLDLYSAEGDFVRTLSATADWDAEAGCWGRAALFSPDSRKVLVHNQNDPLQLLLHTDGNVLARFEHRFSEDAAFSADGGHMLTTLSGVGYGEGAIWNLAGTRVATLPHVNLVHSIAASPDGTIATGSEDGSVKLWSADGVEIYKHVFSGPVEGGVRHVEFSQDGRWLLVVHSDVNEDGPSHSEVDVLSLDLSRVMSLFEGDSNEPSPLVHDLVW